MKYVALETLICVIVVLSKNLKLSWMNKKYNKSWKPILCNKTKYIYFQNSFSSILNIFYFSHHMNIYLS